MKRLSRVIIALILAVLMAGLMPAQVFADTPDYISEIKIYAGSYKDAEKEGYTILNGEDGKPVDLNQGSGSNDTGAKGDKAVYLGYKTTKSRSEAITDLALMNMKGGYDVQEYTYLMETQMNEQILPFIENFKIALAEYRANYYSDNEANKKRAQYAYDALNKFLDDDTGSLLGDLLLNETKQEMGEKAYNALSEEEKKNHADLATIIAQANGQATLMIESLITRAADDNDDTWLERFEGTTYDDLEELYDGSPTDKMKKMAKAYDDDAQEILEMWEAFRNQLDKYEETAALLKEEEAKDLSAEQAIVENYDAETATEEEATAYGEATAAIQQHAELITNYNADVFCHDLLEDIDYGDGTMLDFFMQDTADIEEDASILYPLVASLSAGQRAGLEFVTLQDLVMLGATDKEGYKNAKFDGLTVASIYLGVDREIYKKGGVALTSDALRGKVSDIETPEKKYAGYIWGGIAAGLALVGIGALVASTVVRNSALNAIAAYNNKITSLTNTLKNSISSCKGLSVHMQKEMELIIKNSKDTVISEYVVISGNGANVEEEFGRVFKKYGTYQLEKSLPAIDKATADLDAAVDPDYVARMTERSTYCRYMQAGAAVFTAVMIVTSAVLIYLNYKAMKDYYKVDFTPIPHYMVDKKDLIGYNAKGEEIVLKNQSAYYKAVESNRKKGDSYFKDIDTCADLNGCVNPQWIALYAARNEAELPILADSLKAVVGSADIPQGYETGIHMFGESAAFNLNDKRYCWNQKAKSVMVYFKKDSAAASTSGSNFTSGTIALAGGCGLILGALGTALVMKKTGKREDNTVVTA